MQVINLGKVRGLLALWSQVHSAISHGDVQGFCVTIKRSGNRETTYLGGDYQDDPESAVKAAMRMCWDLPRHEGDSRFSL